MQSFSRGWSFLAQAWQMAFKDKDLIKPSIYALIVGSIVSVIGSIPIIITAFLLGDAGRVGQFILARFIMLQAPRKPTRAFRVRSAFLAVRLLRLCRGIRRKKGKGKAA